MGVKTYNRTIEEVERLGKLLDNELKKVNFDTLSVSEAERLQLALDYSYEFSRDLLETYDDEWEEDEDEIDEGEEDEEI